MRRGRPAMASTPAMVSAVPERAKVDVAEVKAAKVAEVKKAVARLVKRGRPLAINREQTLERLKPWEAEGMSRRAWYYRRKREGGK